MTRQCEMRPSRHFGKPNWIMGQHNGRLLAGEACKKALGLDSLPVGIWNAHDIDRAALVIDAPALTIEDNDSVVRQGVNDFLRAVGVIMVSEDSKLTARCRELCQDGGRGSGWNSSATEHLHVYIVAAKENNIRLEVSSFGHDS